MSRKSRLILVIFSLIVVTIIADATAEEITKDDIRLIVKEESTGWIHAVLGFLGAGIIALFVVVFHYTRHLSNIATDMKEMRTDILTRVRIDLDRIEGIKQHIEQDIDRINEVREETISNIEVLEQIRADTVTNIGQILEKEEEMKNRQESFLQRLQEIINNPGLEEES